MMALKRLLQRPLKRLCLIVSALAVIGGMSRAVDNDVTVVSSTPATSAPPKKTSASDGTPVVHKSSHRKKHSQTASTTNAPSATPPSPVTTTSITTTTVAAPNVPLTTAQISASANEAVTTIVPASPQPAPGSVPSVTSVAPGPAGGVAGAATSVTPVIDTGLPVAKNPGTTISGVTTYVPLPSRPVNPPAASHPAYYASPIPISTLTTSAAGSFSVPTHVTPLPPLDLPPMPMRHYKNTYPWKTNIITTMFWIGEGSTPISATTNVQSSWDQEWLYTNHGSDNPYNRNGYASGSHASTVNPFYCALPFNDLAFPDKARRWVPTSWHRPNKDGKQVSACQHRWVEIKNAKGDVCYAQWEDVGPLRYDHAEYVFGDERPIGIGDDHAGLDVSPAVAEYLNLNDHNRYMSWRFVDDEDVRPGAWLKLDEQAVLYTALHQMKTSRASLPIQRATEPVEDPTNTDSNHKKIDLNR